MELTLNLVWVCVAIAGILVQVVMLSRTVSSSERPVSQCRKIVAMGCSLVILFFVISMTDDLHDQEIVIEERKASRMSAGADVSGPAASARSIPADFLLFFGPEAFSLALPSVSGPLERSESLFVAAIEGEARCGRAPPVSLA
ncbi:MAG TPA: hypothetical protein VE263_15140 [Candidatus Angelobacter sp.]|nr:hypothetical protein [Candidatus Angelobacter sp.]